MPESSNRIDRARVAAHRRRPDSRTKVARSAPRGEYADRERKRVTFAPERSQGPLPAWCERLIFESKSADDLIDRLFERARRAPSVENAVLLGRVANDLGCTEGGAKHLMRIIKRHIQPARRRRS